MKILKIFGIVAGIHVFALILIFANPGCSSTTKPPPAPAETAMQPAPSPAITVPNTSPAANVAYQAPITFNPDAPAVAASSTTDTGGVRFTPTRPGSPVAGAIVAEPVPDVTPATTYTVKSGDNLWNLAKKNHLTVADLAAANSISVRTVLRPGQKLIIPGKSGTPNAVAAAEAAASAGEPAKTVAVKPPTDAMTHVVKPGETLGTIARRYGVKQGDIAVANNISDPQKIRAGMELVIPGWQSPGGKSGKAGSKSGLDKSGKSAAPKNGDARPAFKMDGEQTPPPAPPPTTEVPVIRVDDSPISPAPKN